MKRLNVPALAIIELCLVMQLIIAVPAVAPAFNFDVIAGKWARTDGDYTLIVRNVKADGSADVAYLNPDNIHVAESRVSPQKGLVKLFVKLQDKGYPGSTYTLYYYAEKDALVGFYYQAAMGRTYEVIFLRKDPR